VPHVLCLTCVRCGAEYEPLPEATVCARCGIEGILDVVFDYEAIAAEWSREQLEDSPDQSLWRWLPLVPVDPATPRSPLHHGGTPLLKAPRLAAELGLDELLLKDDGRNPTGSLKDRASAVGVVKCREAGRRIIACSSTGNAASSLAAAAASLGLEAVIFVPHYAAQGKVAQLLMFGATVLSVRGTYREAYRLCQEAAAAHGWYNRNCAVNPDLIEGKKTVGLEIACQMGWEVPDWVVVSVGDGCTIAGIFKGFEDLLRLGWIDRLPRLLAVQAEGSPGIYNFHRTGRLEAVPEETIADAISVGLPRNGIKATRAIRASGGTFLLVSDEQIRAAMRDAGRLAGVFAEPGAAAAVAGLRQAVAGGVIGSGQRVVVCITGNGLKDIPNALAAVPGPIEIEPGLEAVEKALEKGTRSP
jgi:threonine synthase